MRRTQRNNENHKSRHLILYGPHTVDSRSGRKKSCWRQRPSAELLAPITLWRLHRLWELARRTRRAGQHLNWYCYRSRHRYPFPLLVTGSPSAVFCPMRGSLLVPFVSPLRGHIFFKIKKDDWIECAETCVTYTCKNERTAGGGTWSAFYKRGGYLGVLWVSRVKNFTKYFQRRNRVAKIKRRFFRRR